MASLVRRGNIFYAFYFVAGNRKRISLHTDSIQIAKDKIRQIESAQLRGNDDPLPNRTPTADVLTRYVEHARTTKTPKSAQTGYNS